MESNTADDPKFPYSLFVRKDELPTALRLLTLY